MCENIDPTQNAVQFLEYIKTGLERGTIRMLPSESSCKAVPEARDNLKIILLEFIPDLISLLRQEDEEVKQV